MKKVQTKLAEKIHTSNKIENKTNITSLFSTISVSLIIVVIIVAMVLDSFYVSSAIENKSKNLGSKSDTLKVFVDSKLPSIKKSSVFHQNQLKKLQESRKHK